ncbi:MAG: chemotaxis protein CheX [Syntrophales bacterium]|jgi:CheY-specific phosphatase CheX|nr:chemotaxis protein CheX [Syntrophales bacterium]
MIRKTLQNSIFDVFEKMFFVFLERSDIKHLKYRWAASISFSGYKSGKLIVYFSEGIAEVMAQNMLNIAAGELTEKLREDCIKESVNMICGNFLGKFDSSRVFDLSLPLFDAVAGETVTDDNGDDKIVFHFESGSGMLGVVLMFS